MEELRAADADYRRVLELFGRIGIARPNDRANLFLLADQLYSLGDLYGPVGYANLGNVFTASKFYRRALSLSERVVAMKPADRSGKKLHYRCLSSMGSLETALGNEAAAAEYARQALAAAEPISAANPNNVADRMAVALSLDRVARHMTQNVRDALSIFERSVGMEEASYKRNPALGAKAESALPALARGGDNAFAALQLARVLIRGLNRHRITALANKSLTPVGSLLLIMGAVAR